MRTCFALLMLLVVFNAVAQKTPEKLTFELRLAGVKSGEAFYQTNIESIDNKENIHAVLYGYTTGLADDLFAVNDRFESFIEKNKTLPGKSLKKLKEKITKSKFKTTCNLNYKNPSSIKELPI